MKEQNSFCTNKVFNPDFYLLWNGLSKRAGKRHNCLDNAEKEAERIITLGCKNVFIVRPCYMYSCVKAGSKRLVYSKQLNETDYDNSSKLWFVWSKDRKTIKKFLSFSTAQIMAKECATMYNQKYIVLRCIENKWQVK
jgi:hypothetical protein